MSFKDGVIQSHSSAPLCVPLGSDATISSSASVPRLSTSDLMSEEVYTQVLLTDVTISQLNIHSSLVCSSASLPNTRVSHVSDFFSLYVKNGGHTDRHTFEIAGIGDPIPAVTWPGSLSVSLRPPASSPLWHPPHRLRVVSPTNGGWVHSSSGFAVEAVFSSFPPPLVFTLCAHKVISAGVHALTPALTEFTYSSLISRALRHQGMFTRVKRLLRY